MYIGTITKFIFRRSFRVNTRGCWTVQWNKGDRKWSILIFMIKIKIMSKSIEAIWCFFCAFLEIPFHFLQIFVNCIVIDFFKLSIFSERHRFLSLPEKVVFECISYLRPNFLVLGYLLAAPLFACFVLPSFVLRQTLPHGSSWLPSLVPQLDQTVRTSCQNKGLSRLLDDRDIVDPVIMSLDLKYLLDVGRRDDVVSFSMWEIMSVGAILGSSKVVIVFNPVRVFIANHINSNWFQLLFFNEFR